MKLNTIKLSILIILFVIINIININADCDRAGMCRKIVHMMEEDIEACEGSDECSNPGVVDCFNDMDIFNHFSCNAADCIYVQSKLKSGLGATDETCQLYFPQVVGTKFEREPFAGQQNGLGSKTSEKGLWGVGGH